MKRAHIALALLISSAAIIVAADPATSQEQQLAAALKEVQTQQAQIADNQAKIDAKLAIVLEAVRVARIYSSRGGH